MAMGLESALRYLAYKITGKPLTSSSVEGTIRFIADNYTAGAGVPGQRGADGVGIKDITGNIDGENNITIKFTLTNGESKVILGKITPPKA